MTGAIIVAAGSSSRMNGTNKLLVELNGMSVIAHTLANFEKCKCIDYIIVVIRDDMRNYIYDIINKYNFSKVKDVVEGGASRQESVQNGLTVCPKDTEIIAIHDGARPFASEELICDTISACKEFGAAMPGVPVKDTIKMAENNFIVSTPLRDKLYIAQTPQVFEFETYVD